MLNKKLRSLLAGFVVLLVVCGIIFEPAASASILFNRSVLISSPVPSAVTTETIQFDVPTNNVIGSIVFQYCSNSSSFF